jgi:hypothetical protein
VKKILKAKHEMTQEGNAAISEHELNKKEKHEIKLA